MNQTDRVELKIISALEKCFIDETLQGKRQLKKISGLKNEIISFQIAFRCIDTALYFSYAKVKASGVLQPYLTMRQVAQVSSCFPAYPDKHDDNYLRTQPGLYPDALIPLHYEGKVCFGANLLFALFCEIELSEKVKAGSYALKIGLYNEQDECLAEQSIEVEIIGAELPKLPIKHTEWFYTDCLVAYYHTEAFSKRHFEIIENYIKTAARNGINTILTPVFTPELDTYVGRERLTTQLVRIKRKNGKYSFDYTFLDRWLEICKKYGIEYLEIPPFYTQWGATSAPKFIAEENGEEKQIFGWETDALSSEYIDFLNEFIPSLLQYFRNRGIDKNCIFHISDEPNRNNLDHYGKIAQNVKKHLTGYTVIDALSNVEFCKLGVLTQPVPIVSAVSDFLKAGEKDIWCYYCCETTTVYTNRFFAMPSARTRILGIQLYKYAIKGFLHWGFNFWNNRFSFDAINPFLETSGEFFAPSGDAFLVYPAQDGTAYESLRLIAMRDAMQDFRALKLLESLTSRENVLTLIQEGLSYELSFADYPHSEEYLLSLREKVNAAICTVKN